MPRTESVKFDVNEEAVALLFGELDHRIRNLLMMIEAIVRQTKSTSVEDYRTALTRRIGGLYEFYQFTTRHNRMLGLAGLLEQTMSPYSANGTAQVLAAGPDLELKPSLALALHLVFHELATNAEKYGALSSPNGRVKIEWEIGHVLNARRKLAIVWTEQGGPDVKIPQRRGFGSRLIEKILAGHGGVRLDFSPTGLSCFMLIDLDRPGVRK
jgi:two-component sensor histidine kinase